MAYHAENSADREIAPTLTNEAVAALLPVLTRSENPLAELLSVVLNAAMRLERQEHLRAEPHERCAERNGHANGFKERNLTTRLGQIGVSVPALIVPHDVRPRFVGVRDRSALPVWRRRFSRR